MYHIMSHTSSSDIEIESTVVQSNISTMLNDINDVKRYEHTIE